MRHQLTRYLAVSLVALSADYALLVGMASSGAATYMAAASAYMAGGIVHYLLSRRFVFGGGWLRQRPVIEFGAFMSSALVGTVLTAGTVQLATEVASMPFPVSKGLAVAVSMVATFWLRRAVVFSG